MWVAAPIDTQRYARTRTNTATETQRHRDTEINSFFSVLLRVLCVSVAAFLCVLPFPRCRIQREVEPVLMRKVPSSRRSRYAPWQAAHFCASVPAEVFA